MASVTDISPDLIFHPAAGRLAQQLTVTVTLRRGDVRIEVQASTGGPFEWDEVVERMTVEAGEARKTRQIPVTFLPGHDALMERSMRIGVLDLTEITAPLRYVDVPLLGNVPGVGPGALEIVNVAAGAEGDLHGEVVFVRSVMPIELDLSGCTFGDRVSSGAGDATSADPPERVLLPQRSQLPFDVGPRLRPGEVLRIFTGIAPSNSRPPLKDISLNFKTNLWSHPDDIVWIRNELGQLVVTHRCVAPAEPLRHS